MSQAKVDQRKEAKRNVKETMRKEKLQRTASIVLAALIAAILLGWAAYSIGRNVYKSIEGEHVYREIDLSPISDYMSSLAE